MSLWYTQGSSRYKDKGKFQKRERIGLTSSGHEEYRGWSYHFTSHQAGTSVRRTTYSVSIADPYCNRVEYLRNFSSIEQAATAARDWIDVMFEKMGKALPNANLGNIPKFPNAAVNQEK